ncbi:MAG TPA: SURF1 family protein [Rudaea sp.]|nr:SURF1 family protein [Rudaea sp.]
MTRRVWHRPSLFACVLTLVGVVIFCTLGIWQLQRKAEKEKFLTAFAEAPKSAPVELSTVKDIADDTRYPHVHAVGHFIADRGYLFDEQFHAGEPGVRVIAVFDTGGDRPLLVDRGWIAWNHAPGTQPSVPPLASQTDITGIYAPYPGGGIRVGGNPLPSQTTWPKLTLHLDPAEISADLGKRVLPRILLSDPDASSGFVREWTPNVMPPERHAAYAFQWFALAVAAFAILIARHWRKVDNATK